MKERKKREEKKDKSKDEENEQHEDEDERKVQVLFREQCGKKKSDWIEVVC